MSKNHNALPPIPAQRYFSEDELCRLADISALQFSNWQQEHGFIIGYGGCRYTRQDVLKVRRLRDSFSPYLDRFNRNHTDVHGNPAIDAMATRQELTTILTGLQNALDK